MMPASRGAELMMVASSFSSAGLDCSSENSWMPAGRPCRKASKRTSALSARRVSPKASSSAGVSSVSRSRASAERVAR